jgi:hypothetical protein
VADHELVDLTGGGAHEELPLDDLVALAVIR